MKKIIIPILLSLVLLEGINGQNNKQPRIDPWLKMVERSFQNTSKALVQPMQIQLKKHSRGLRQFGINDNEDNPKVRAIIEYIGNENVLEAAGATLRTKVGDFYTSEFSIQDLGELPTHARGDGLGLGFHRVCFVAKV